MLMKKTQLRILGYFAETLSPLWNSRNNCSYNYEHQTMKAKTNKEAVGSARRVLPIAGQKFQRHFQRYVEFFRSISKISFI